MPTTDDTLRRRVREAWPDPSQPPAFEAAWAAAEQRRGGRRYGYGLGAAAAAVTAAAIILISSGTPPAESYVEVADLMNSTYWAAPSDVLLPESEFDIYQDLPELFESTDPAGGALL
ncbi:MAG: hypothetical protein QNI96_05825 [Woeseiaceae bacterium]|nr:hypothetical protein [Woeseiaceae bacterium]